MKNRTQGVRDAGYSMFEGFSDFSVVRGNELSGYSSKGYKILSILSEDVPGTDGIPFNVPVFLMGKPMVDVLEDLRVIKENAEVSLEAAKTRCDVLQSENSLLTNEVKSLNNKLQIALDRISSLTDQGSQRRPTLS